MMQSVQAKATCTPPAETIKTKENISNVKEIPRPNGLLLKKPITMDIFPWTKDFQNLCKSSLNPTRSTTLIVLMTFLLSNARKGIELCYKKSLRAAKLKEIIKEALPFFTYLRRFENSEDKKQTQYFELMSDLLAIYVDLELISSKRDLEPQTKRISNKISSYIILNLENLTEYMLETLMKVSLISETYNNILDPVFTRILTRIPPNPETDIMFVRYLLVFKLWKRMKSNINDRAKIQNAAMMSLGPALPEGLPKLIVERVLPESSDPKKTKSYLRAPIDFRKACAEFLDYVKEKRACRRKNAVTDKERNPRLNCPNIIEDVTNKVDRVNSSLNKISKLDSSLGSIDNTHANNVGTPKHSKKFKNNDILIDLTDDDITKVIKLSKRNKIGWLEVIKHDVSTKSNKILSAPAEDSAGNFTKITVTPEIHYDRKAAAASPVSSDIKATTNCDSTDSRIVAATVTVESVTKATDDTVDISNEKEKPEEVSLSCSVSEATVKQEKIQDAAPTVVQPRLIVSSTLQGHKRKSDPIVALTGADRSNTSETEEKSVSEASPCRSLPEGTLANDEKIVTGVILPAPLTNDKSEKENKPIAEVSTSVLVVNVSKKDDRPVPTVLKSPITDVTIKTHEKLDPESIKPSVIINSSVHKEKMDLDNVQPRTCVPVKEFQRSPTQIRDSILVSTKANNNPHRDKDHPQDTDAKVRKVSALRDADKTPMRDVELATISKVSDTDVFTEIQPLNSEKSIANSSDQLEARDDKVEEVRGKLNINTKVIRVASEESLRANTQQVAESKLIDFKNKMDELPHAVQHYSDIQGHDIDGLTLLATISARHVKVKPELDDLGGSLQELIGDKLVKFEADDTVRQGVPALAAYVPDFKCDATDGSNEHPNVILNGETVRLFQKSPNSNLYIINKAEMEEINFNYQNTLHLKTEFKQDPEYPLRPASHGEKQQQQTAAQPQPQTQQQQPPQPPTPEAYYPSGYLNRFCTYAHVLGAHRHDCQCALYRPVSYYVPAASHATVVQNNLAVHEDSDNSSNSNKRKRDEKGELSNCAFDASAGAMVSCSEKVSSTDPIQNKQKQRMERLESHNPVRSSSSSSRLPLKKRYMAEQKLHEYAGSEENNPPRCRLALTPGPAVASAAHLLGYSDSDIYNYPGTLMEVEKPPGSPVTMLLDLGATVEVSSSTESPPPPSQLPTPASSRGRGRPAVAAARKRKSGTNTDRSSGDNDGSGGAAVIEPSAKKTKKAVTTNGSAKKPPRTSKRSVPVVNYELSDDQASPVKRKRKKTTR